MENRQENTGIFSPVRMIVLEPMLSAVAILVLTVLTDNLTAAYLGTSLMFYALSYGAFSVAGRKRISRVVRMYHDNLFYVNCKDYLWSTLGKSLLMTLVPTFFLLFFGGRAAEMLKGTVKAGLPLFVCAFCLPVTAAGGVFSGFNEGMRREKTVRVFDMFYSVVSPVLLVLFGILGYRYGMKIDALLYTNDCAGTYAALFATAGILLAGIIRMGVLFITVRRVLKKLAPLHETGKPKYMGEKSPYLKVAWQEMLALVMLPAIILVGSAVFSNSSEQSSAELLGLFYGHYLPYIVLFGVTGALSGIGRALALFTKTQEEEGEPSQSGEKFYELLHMQCIVSFPVGTFLMALAPCIEGGIFLRKNQTAELLLTLGGFAGALLSLGIALGILLVLSKRQLPLFLCALAGAIFSVVAAVLTTVVLGRGIFGMVAALLIFGLIFNLVAVLMLKVIFGIRRRPIFLMMVRPFIVSAISALIISLVSMGLKYLVGEIPACVISVFLGSVLYLIMLSVFRGIEEAELRAIPGGRLLEKISARSRRGKGIRNP